MNAANEQLCNISLSRKLPFVAFRALPVWGGVFYGREGCFLHSYYHYVVLNNTIQRNMISRCSDNGNRISLCKQSPHSLTAAVKVQQLKGTRKRWPPGTLCCSSLLQRLWNLTSGWSFGVNQSVAPLCRLVVVYFITSKKVQLNNVDSFKIVV